MTFEHHRADDPVEALKESNEWLKTVAIYVPIITFLFGFGSGIITAALL